MNDKIPAISVIVPLYNAEKYIAQCLGSILNQSFQDFEVIVVDDCSTDNSVAIVENIAPKFDGRLHLIKRNKNSGGAAIPRNVGLRLSRGKYISFIDNDDLFLKNALEVFYNIAENTQAEVVHAEKYLIPKNVEDEITVNTQFIIHTMESGGFVNKITLETEDLAERMKMYRKRRFWGLVWNKLFLRDFIIKHDIEFPNLQVADDMIFSFFCLCFAKKYVRIPNVLNIYRMRDDSFSHEQLKIDKHFHKWINLLIQGTKILYDFMNDIDFFIQNPKFKYLPLDYFIQTHIDWHFKKYYEKYPHYNFDELLYKEFSKETNNNNIAFMTYLFNLNNFYNVQINNKQNEINKLKQYILTLQKKLQEGENNC